MMQAWWLCYKVQRTPCEGPSSWSGDVCCCTRSVAFMVATNETTNIFCVFLDFESCVQTAAGNWFKLGGLTHGVCSLSTFSGYG